MLFVFKCCDKWKVKIRNFYKLTKNPLPDGNFTIKVTKKI